MQGPQWDWQLPADASEVAVCPAGFSAVAALGQLELGARCRSQARPRGVNGSAFGHFPTPTPGTSSEMSWNVEDFGLP